MKPENLGPWPHGVNNRQPQFSQAKDQYGHTTTLSNAVNVDLTNAGYARRRQGYELVHAGVSTRAGYSCSEGVFFVDSGNLMRLNADDTATLMFSGLAGSEVAYECAGDVVYISDGTVNLRIVGGVVTDWPVDAHLVDDPEIMGVPAGHIVRFYKGRIYIASGNTLWYTEPYALGSVHRLRNFIQFKYPIDIMEPVTAGIWVVAGDTKFLRGSGPDEFVLESALPYGAARGTSVQVPFSGNVMWYSERGVLMATSDGQIKNVQEEHLVPESATHGAALIKEYNGVKQYLASVQNQGVAVGVANSFMDMEVVRQAGG